MEQFDIFGGISEPPEKPKPDRKFKTMQEQCGTIPDHTCKECYHHLTYHYHDKYYHKCELWKISHSTATDIRLKDTACKKFVPGERKIMSE
jgi:hypothetical protein